MNKLDLKTKIWVLEIVKACGSDTEAAAKWMARNFRSLGGIRQMRSWIAEAMEI